MGLRQVLPSEGARSVKTYLLKGILGDKRHPHYTQKVN